MNEFNPNEFTGRNWYSAANDELKNNFRAWLYEQLMSGILEIKFIKTDGSERVMVSTLQKSYLPPAPERDSDYEPRAKNFEVIAVWDIDKSAWRSFRLDSIESFKPVLELAHA